MRFEEKELFIKEMNVFLLQLCKNSNKDRNFSISINTLKDILNDANFKHELNEKLYEAESKEDYIYLIKLIENLLFGLVENDQIQRELKNILIIIEKISTSRIKQFLRIEVNILKRLLTTKHNLYDIDDLAKILNIVLNLSEAKIYDKLVFDDDDSRQEI